MADEMMKLTAANFESGVLFVSEEAEAGEKKPIDIRASHVAQTAIVEAVREPKKTSASKKNICVDTSWNAPLKRLYAN